MASNKSGILFLIIVFLTSVGEGLMPIFPFIAIGCFLSYLLGKSETKYCENKMKNDNFDQYTEEYG